MKHALSGLASGRTANPRWRLTVALDCVLLTCLLVSAVWLWHESKGQIELLVDELFTTQAHNAHIGQEIRKSIAPLSIPSLVLVIASLILASHAVNGITRLKKALNAQRADNPKPFTGHPQANVSTAVIPPMNPRFPWLSDTLIVGSLWLDLSTQHVRLGNSPVILTPKEYAILTQLMLKAGQPVHREWLHQSLYRWNDDTTSNSLDVHIHHLRQKIGQTRILTLRGFGYLLTCEDES